MALSPLKRKEKKKSRVPCPSICLIVYSYLELAQNNSKNVYAEERLT